MNKQSATPQPPNDPGSRSEGLLPTDGTDPNLDIAEEVSFDLQSDSTRRVGALPPDTPVSQPAAAIAKSLAPPPEDAADVQTTDVQTTDVQTTDVQTTDVQTTDVHTTDAQTTDAQTTDAQLHDAIDRALPPSV